MNLRDSKKSAGSGSKTCEQCGRSFSRTEHLDRHLLTHTQQRPHRCDSCGQRFRRSDVLHRHISRYCPNLEPDAATSQHKRPRVRLACQPCRTKKLRCDGKLPCCTCNSKGYSCQYPEREIDIETPQSHGPHGQMPDTDASFHAPTAPSNTNGSESSTSLQGTRFTLNPLAMFGGSDGDVPETALEEATIADVDKQSVYFEAGNDQICAIGPTPPSNVDILATSNEDWDFDWNMETTMNDFSFFDWMPGELGFDFLSPVEGLEYGTDLGLVNHFSQTIDGKAEAKSEPRTLALQTLKYQLGSAYDTSCEHEPSIDAWLLQPRIPREYDIELLNLLLNIFMEIVPSTFTSFAGFEITESSLPEQVLAMAAVGALFSDEPSFRVARTLYGDASRMLVGSVPSQSRICGSSGTSLAQAHLALELFGFCSGHKRSNEMSEAFHMHTVQNFVDCGLLPTIGRPNPQSQMHWQRIRGDLFVVECYRIVLAQLPPLVRLEAVQEYMDQDDSPATEPSASISIPTNDDIHRMAATSILSWSSIGTWTDSSRPYHGTIWRREATELELRKLAKKIRGSERNPAMLLYHMTIITVHAPMEMINSYAYSYAHNTEISPALMSTLRQWQQDEDCDVAYWHATQITRLAGRRDDDDKQSYETPHDALCLFLATIVVWCSGVISGDRRRHARTALEEGILNMGHFRVRVKVFLTKILKRLLQHTEEQDNV